MSTHGKDSTPAEEALEDLAQIVAEIHRAKAALEGAGATSDIEKLIYHGNRLRMAGRELRLLADRLDRIARGRSRELEHRHGLR